ncbi:unnamed protein product [Adineta steineri]|uniref:Uncharacterized protein n=1 Tax=Adineta steineri TaxID=433720 RepID=A0A814HIV9_9BILA|nr:unnamed protein product [Adineta steineri]CAF4071687.1 unnamed protein product [Adineta steineri]
MKTTVTHSSSSRTPPQPCSVVCCTAPAPTCTLCTDTDNGGAAAYCSGLFYSFGKFYYVYDVSSCPSGLGSDYLCSG